MIADFADCDVSEKSWPGEPVVERLRRLKRYDLRRFPRGVALPASIFVADGTPISYGCKSATIGRMIREGLADV